MSSNHSNNISNIFITITTLIFAITSLVTVFISLSAWRNERETVKPYLTFLNSPQIYFEKNELIFSFKLTNSGLHPVASLYCQTIIVDCTLDQEPLHTDQYSLVNNIPQNTTTDLIIKISCSLSEINKENINQHYIIIDLRYMDPILEKKHEQLIYLRWLGITNGKPNLVFHASKEDKNRIIEYLGKF